MGFARGGGRPRKRLVVRLRRR